MKHPSQEILALHAGGRSGLAGGLEDRRGTWRGASSARDEVAAFSGMREVLPELERDPRDSVESHGGGDAGEYPPGAGRRRVRPRCDAAGVRAHAAVHAARAPTLALASVLALMVTGLMLERPAPAHRRGRASRWCKLRRNGIQRRSGDQGFALMHAARAERHVLGRRTGKYGSSLHGSGNGPGDDDESICGVT